MKLSWISALVLSLALSSAFAQDKDEKKDAAKSSDDAPPKTLAEKVSYGIGLNIGKNMKKDGVDVDIDLLVKGIKDAMAGKKPLLSEAEVREAMTAFQKEMQAKQAERAKGAGEKNKKRSEERRVG